MSSVTAFATQEFKNVILQAFEAFSNLVHEIKIFDLDFVKNESFNEALNTTNDKSWHIIKYVRISIPSSVLNDFDLWVLMLFWLLRLLGERDSERILLQVLDLFKDFLEKVEMWNYWFGFLVLVGA